MPRTSAGILLCRRRGDSWEVLLTHPGGPFWAKKDDGAWSIPKGELEPGELENPVAAAARELEEETGAVLTVTPHPLPKLKQPGGKIVIAFAAEQDFDTALFRSNTFSLEWPPRSGMRRDFPEVDRIAWFTMDVARRKIQPGQAPLLDALVAQMSVT